MKNTKRGFTLIELLVIVLIIGILAAVAVPQYKTAVVKSRVASILPILSTLRKAEETYYVANGVYTTSIQELDVDIPCVENISEESSMPYWKCGNDFLVQVSDSGAYANYCPGYNNSYEECEPKRSFQLGYRYLNISKGKRICYVRNESVFGRIICKSLGGIQNTQGDITNDRYWLD